MKFNSSNPRANRVLSDRFFKVRRAHKEQANPLLSGSSSGVAYVELAILLAILFPLVATFAFVWLPSFARRSDNLMTSLASMSACLADPISLYRFQGGELVLKDDYQQIAEGVVKKCAEISAGETFCGFVFDKSGNQVATIKINDKNGRCGTVDPESCVGLNPPPGGIVVAFVLEDGTTRCEFTPADDPGADKPVGEEQVSLGPIQGPCPTNYFQGLCQLVNYTAPNYTLNIICCMNGRGFDSASNKCTACPTGFHSCTVTVPSDQTYKRCIPDGHSRLGNGGCCNVPTASAGSYCANTEVACTFGLSNFKCCPSECTLHPNGTGCMDPFRLSASYTDKGRTDNQCGCNESDVELSTTGACPLALQFPISGTSTCAPETDGTILDPPPGQC